MRLFHSPASPFVRKVMVTALETGLAARIERVRAVVSPVARDPQVVAHNPSGHIPTLVLEDGTVLFDSGVICQYLDTLHDGPPLLPAEPLARARTLCQQALADGLLTAGVLMRYESALRPEALRWDDWYDGQRAKVRSSLSALSEVWPDHLRGPLDIGVIATACALEWLDFRFPDDPWRADHPRLADWLAGFAQRPSMLATRPSPVV
ncbi:MAG: glutathione S-transferase [Burkholderiaceae bacterium]